MLSAKSLFVSEANVRIDAIQTLDKINGDKLQRCEVPHYSNLHLNAAIIVYVTARPYIIVPLHCRRNVP